MLSLSLGNFTYIFPWVHFTLHVKMKKWKGAIKLSTTGTCSIIQIFFSKVFLPPATKLRQGKIFTGVSQSFCSLGGGGGVRGRGRACVTCMPPRYHETRSMGGRYASYWNAFLLKYGFSSNYTVRKVLKKICLLQWLSLRKNNYSKVSGNKEYIYMINNFVQLLQ